MVEFILPLCLLIVSAFRSIYHDVEAYELTGYRVSNALSQHTGFSVVWECIDERNKQGEYNEREMKRER